MIISILVWILILPFKILAIPFKIFLFAYSSQINTLIKVMSTILSIGITFAFIQIAGMIIGVHPFTIVYDMIVDEILMLDFDPAERVKRYIDEQIE